MCQFIAQSCSWLRQMRSSDDCAIAEKYWSKAWSLAINRIIICGWYSQLCGSETEKQNKSEATQIDNKCVRYVSTSFKTEEAENLDKNFYERRIIVVNYCHIIHCSLSLFQQRATRHSVISFSWVISRRTRTESHYLMTLQINKQRGPLSRLLI